MKIKGTALSVVRFVGTDNVTAMKVGVQIGKPANIIDEQIPLIIEFENFEELNEVAKAFEDMKTMLINARIKRQELVEEMWENG